MRVAAMLAAFAALACAALPSQPVLLRDSLRRGRLHTPFMGDTTPDVLSMLSWRFEQWLEYLADHKASLGSPMTFIQIGANDGIANDPLYPVMRRNFSRWVGLQVEPGTFNYKRLLTLHGPQRKLGWAFAKVVVTDKCQGPNVTFYEFPQTVSKEDFNDTTAVRGIPRYIQIGQTNGLSPQRHLLPRQLPC
eukprot:Hpha_TRINITY_DN28606_c0_g1::TRINITY_DN28606_c0_g1_i1::g.156462::m.156462